MKALLSDIAGEVKRKQLVLMAAGVAFFALLSLVPAMLAAVSIYGLVATPADVHRQIGEVADALPDNAANLIVKQLDLISSAHASLSLTFVISVLLALWSASSGMRHLMAATTLASGHEERRTFVKMRGTALLLTLGAIVVIGVLFGALALVPAIDSAVAGVVRWPLVVAIMLLGIGVLYRFGPDRADDGPPWGIFSWGSLVALVVWIIASIGLAVYSSVFPNLNRTYGSLAGVIVLLLWLLLSSLSVLLGAQVNACLERRSEGSRRGGAPASPEEPALR